MLWKEASKTALVAFCCALGLGYVPLPADVATTFLIAQFWCAVTLTALFLFGALAGI
jgi:hypothetical protein